MGAQQHNGGMEGSHTAAGPWASLTSPAEWDEPVADTRQGPKEVNWAHGLWTVQDRPGLGEMLPNGQGALGAWA